MRNGKIRLNYKVSYAPKDKRFERGRPSDLQERRKHLQRIAQAMKKTGRNLADATNKKDLP